MDLTARLLAIGRDEGLAALGVCSVEPFFDVRENLVERVARGLSGGMKFTFRDPVTSTDVGASFPWAQRLVVAAWSYLPEAGDPGPAAPGTGRVARFATKDHYRGLRRALETVAAGLESAGYRAEVLVDDNRLVDRAAAVRAGVAWWGKNTMALTPGHGPWFLLGSVVTDAPLSMDEPMKRDCGTCEACLPACPTGALVRPGVLDARRCLAHLAQAPGPIPVEHRAAMADRVYGCDDCLDACPPGHRVLGTASSTRRGRVDLIEVLAAADRTLLGRFAHFYIPRRQARFLRRNALVALGNGGGSRAVGVAAGYLGHPDPLLRRHAAWALGALGGSAAAAALATATRAERDDDVISEIEAALLQCRSGPVRSRS